MDKQIKISIIIAVYERKIELSELLNSLTQQTYKDFEVIVVDDGSKETLEETANNFSSELNIKYFYKENSGAGKSRNYGMQKATGNYFVFLDSDVIVPENYLEIVKKSLQKKYTDAFGGPDAADKNFNSLQKAISFSMTSFLTTGGIRGGKKHVGKFQPRSFNMGISKEAFLKTGGFGNLRIGEDPDLSMLIWENGFETQLISKAEVYHKRRTDFKKFSKQVFQFGIARPILNKRHPKYKKITFWFPTLFIFGIDITIILGILLLFFHNKIICGLFIFSAISYFLYFIFIFILSFVWWKSLKTAFLSVISTLIQFYSYGLGFVISWFKLNILKQNPEEEFPMHYYKK